MGIEELGPVQLRLMLDDDVHPKFDWLARRGLLHNTHRCIQRENGQTSQRKGSFFKSKIELGKLVWHLFLWATDEPSHHVAWHLGVSLSDDGRQDQFHQGHLCGGHAATVGAARWV